MTDMEEIEQLKRLKARYFRTMDTKDWKAMREVFADDVVMDTTASGGSLTVGGDEFMAFLEPALRDAITIHHGHMPEIELTSPSTARGIWAVQDIIVWPDGTRMHGYGHYHETYQKIDGHWQIKTSTLTRLHMDFSGAGS
jgi:uncharacterized protein (TIGR02246 family)